MEPLIEKDQIWDEIMFSGKRMMEEWEGGAADQSCQAPPLHPDLTSVSARFAKPQRARLTGVEIALARRARLF
jgi:hypothetical protein